MRISHLKFPTPLGIDYLKKWVLLGTLIGIFSGAGAIAFTLLLKYATYLFLGLGAGFTPPSPSGEGELILSSIKRLWAIPLITTLGGFISGLIVEKLAPEAEGHGTDAAIDAFHRKEGRIRRRIPLLKLIASAITIGSGGSAGREGPIAQVSAGLASLVSELFKLSPKERRIALAVGIGAGIGTIFKAPLGGAILGASILYRRDIETEALLPSFIASVVGYSIYCVWHGWGRIFEAPSLYFQRPQELLSYILLGIACAILGIVYARTFYGVRNLFRRLSLPLSLKSAMGGLGTGIIALFLPQVLGVGYGWLQLAINGDTTSLPLWIMATLIPAKILATSLSIGSGGSGGVFAPGLFIGGMLGGSLWWLLHRFMPFITPDSISAFVIVGMMSLFGGIAKAPLAVILMVSEMTGEYTMLVPSMLSVAIVYILTGKHSIYESQVPTRAESPAHRPEYYIPLLQSLSVREAMSKNPITISPNASALEAGDILKSFKVDALPVIENGSLVGIVATLDIAPIPPSKRAEIKVSDIMSRDLVVTYPDESLFEAMSKMTRYDISHLPVVSRESPKELVGIITPSDITKLYSLKMLEREE